MALGSAVHEGLAEYHRHLQLNEPLPTSHVQETFLNAWQASEDRQLIQFRDTENRDDVLARGAALLDLYLQEPPPQDIVAIEEALMVPLFTSSGECLEKPLIAVWTCCIAIPTGWSSASTRPADDGTRNWRPR